MCQGFAGHRFLGTQPLPGDFLRQRQSNPPVIFQTRGGGPAAVGKRFMYTRRRRGTFRVSITNDSPRRSKRDIRDAGFPLNQNCGAEWKGEAPHQAVWSIVAARRGDLRAEPNGSFIRSSHLSIHPIPRRRMAWAETRVGPWPSGFLAWAAVAAVGGRVWPARQGNINENLPAEGGGGGWVVARPGLRPSRDGDGVSVWRDGMTDGLGRA
ncbi:hypothetical protein LY76DRAFT_112988 [Colletotrichum caudatum]|nr:hypothetical protein LY76DRAFT_112988 [Colletotrichum caudatum]